MATTLTLRATNEYNEKYAPAGAKKAYLARVEGRDKATTFKRTFLARETTFDGASCPVLVEKRSVSKKGHPYDPDYYLLLVDTDGDLMADDPQEAEVSREDAMWLAAQMDLGRSLDSCWDVDNWERQTQKQAEKAAVAATIDTVTNNCWDSLKALSEKDAKKVLAALKTRLNPPKTAAAVGGVDETPVTAHYNIRGDDEAGYYWFVSRPGRAGDESDKFPTRAEAEADCLREYPHAVPFPPPTE